MRKKPNLLPRLNRCEKLIVKEPELFRGKWAEIRNTSDICVEIGCGKGKFLTETALKDPERLFVGIERERGALVMALEKAFDLGLSNILFIDGDADKIDEIFNSSELTGIYLNFSDPWPKNKQAKRRLTHENFLKRYDTILKDNGWIYFKTDNEKLFEFSLNSFSDYGFRLKNITFDLHLTDYPNVITEYEARFSEQGMRIYRAEAYK